MLETPISTVVAAHATGIPAVLTVLGPGADGELPTDLVGTRLRERSARRIAALTDEVAKDHIGLLDWNPSEATALLIAAAFGFRGTVEMRDQGLPVTLDSGQAEAWTLSIDRALPPASITELVERTRDESQLRTEFSRTYGVDEIAYEERKAGERKAGKRTGSPSETSPFDPHTAEALLTESTRRGTDWFTRRRLREALYPAQPTNDELEMAVGHRWQPPLVATR